VVLGYASLVARAVQLHAVDGEWLAQRARSQHESTLHLAPLRGEIADRNGELLSVSVDVGSVAASPRRVRDRSVASARLAPILGMRARDITELLSPHRGFVWIKRWVSPVESEGVRRLALEGISLAAERRRLYPNGELAAAYLGFAGRDEVGLSGIELAYDGPLRGARSEIPALRDGRGRKLVAWGGEAETRRGARLVLSLDAQLQHAAERALDRAIERTGARAASLVALDPWTGDLLAMAERPGFDPNRFWKEAPRRFRMRAFTDPFEPGSTLKPFVMARALEAGVVEPETRINCENGEWSVADRVIHDWRPHGVLTAGQVLTHSSNIGAAKIAEQLGSKRLVEGLRRFGFGRRTGSGFPGDSRGVLPSISSAQVVERSTLAFGQGMTSTAAQLAVAGAALANGGHRVWPRAVLRIEGPEGRFDWPPGRGERVLSEPVARQVLGLLREAVENGTGSQAQVSGIPVAGKTGTAQKAVRGGYSKDRFVASFLGFLPAERPRIVCVVVLDEPRHPHTGGAAAAPVFREFAADAAHRFWIGNGGTG
jgi:cell division protein FtsI (penicillin-binding protein 3)